MVTNTLNNTNQHTSINFSEFVSKYYPSLKIEFSSPDIYASIMSAMCFLRDGDTLCCPKGLYRSSKYYAQSNCHILDVEDGRQKLNLPKRPLILLQGVVYGSGGNYPSRLNKTYYLFGQNENYSYFLHRVKPSIGDKSDLSLCRKWMWSLKEHEKITARQGDLAFISKTKVDGIVEVSKTVELENHIVTGDEVRKTSKRIYVLNPSASHYEHHSVICEGWHELRLARAWQGTAD
jgi:hypothetical protein